MMTPEDYAARCQKRAVWMASMRQRLSVIVVEIPAVFQGDKPKPLAIGIHKDLRSKTNNHDGLSRWFKGYTRNPWYLHQLSKPDSQRHDLDGEPVDKVDANHRRWAKIQYDKRLKAKRKAAERKVAA